MRSLTCRLPRRLSLSPGGIPLPTSVSVPPSCSTLTRRKSGLTALAGTQNFSLITSRLDPSTCNAEAHASAALAYAVFLDRLMGYITAYLGKLLAAVPLSEVRLVFAGGIGEHSAKLRHDVLARLRWLGAEHAERRGSEQDGAVRLVSSDESALRAYVVETDEEGWCAHLARERFGF
jgi:acetate kinase